MPTQPIALLIVTNILLVGDVAMAQKTLMGAL